jgi:DNA polymerase-3 subunit alpha
VVSSFQDVNKLVRAAAKAAEAAGPAGEEGKAVEVTGKAASPASGPAGEKEAAPPQEEKAAPPQAEAGYREVHVRLKSDTAEREEVLYPLLAWVRENPGSCSLLIHVPLRQGETVIRGGSQIAAAVSRDALARCAAVAEVWLN